MLNIIEYGSVKAEDSWGKAWEKYNYLAWLVWTKSVELCYSTRCFNSLALTILN